MSEAPSVARRAGTIAGFAFEVIVRVVLFALLYAAAALISLLAMWIVSRFIHLVLFFTAGPYPLLNQLVGWVFIGMVILAGVAGAAAGAAVAIGSVLIRPFLGMLALSLIATLAPVIYFASLSPRSLEAVPYYLAGGALAGLLGLLGARASGLLQPDRRLLQDVWSGA